MGGEGLVLLKLFVCKLNKMEPSMLGLVAALLSDFFSHIFPLQGVRQTARTFCCPAWSLLLLNLVLVDRVSMGLLQQAGF